MPAIEDWQSRLVDALLFFITMLSTVSCSLETVGYSSESVRLHWRAIDNRAQPSLGCAVVSSLSKALNAGCYADGTFAVLGRLECAR